MGCLLTFFALACPRLAFFMLWTFTDRVAIAFDHFLVPLLGLVFLPYTALSWAVAYDPLRGVTGVGWLVVFVAVLLDVGSYAGSGNHARRRHYEPLVHEHETF